MKTIYRKLIRKLYDRNLNRVAAEKLEQSKKIMKTQRTQQHPQVKRDLARLRRIDEFRERLEKKEKLLVSISTKNVAETRKKARSDIKELKKTLEALSAREETSS